MNVCIQNYQRNKRQYKSLLGQYLSSVIWRVIGLITRACTTSERREHWRGAGQLVSEEAAEMCWRTKTTDATAAGSNTAQYISSAQQTGKFKEAENIKEKKETRFSVMAQRSSLQCASSDPIPWLLWCLISLSLRLLLESNATWRLCCRLC